MDGKMFVTISSTCSVTKTTWVGRTDVSWSNVAWLNVLKTKMSSLWEVIARDYVFSVKIADGGGGLGYLNNFNLKKHCEIVIRSLIRRKLSSKTGKWRVYSLAHVNLQNMKQIFHGKT